jgi:hypothetical protein
MEHKFTVGQIVTITSSASRHIPRGNYEIVRQLPTGGEGPQYQVKSTADGHLRNIGEAELSALGA